MEVDDKMIELVMSVKHVGIIIASGEDLTVEKLRNQTLNSVTIRRLSELLFAKYYSEKEIFNHLFRTKIL